MNRPQQNHRRAFTIIELLVVIGIIALLASIALPMVLRAMRSGQRTRQAADLNTIAMALEAYKQDFGDYPRPTAAGTGFAVLTKAMFGPYGVSAANLPTPPPDQGAPGSVQNVSGGQVSVGPDSSGNPTWVNFVYTDGADGPGFRVGPNTVDVGSPTARPGGKVYGPYLETGKFKLRGLAMLDYNGNPIMYFPVNSRKLNLNVATGNTFYADSTVVRGATAQIMFNFDDNGTLAISMTPEKMLPDALARFQVMLGDNSSIIPDGRISGSEVAATTGPFILWSAGADGLFGTPEKISSMNNVTEMRTVIRKCDDVTNFTFAP